jgi:hypothetical protein
LISRRVVSDLLITWTALPTTSAGHFSPLGPLGEDDPFRFKNLVNSMDDFRDGVVRSPERQQVISSQSDSIPAQRFCRTHCGEVGNRVLSITFQNFAAYGAAVDKMGEDKEVRAWQAKRMKAGYTTWVRSNMATEIEI